MNENGNAFQDVDAAQSPKSSEEATGVPSEEPTMAEDHVSAPDTSGIEPPQTAADSTDEFPGRQSQPEESDREMTLASEAGTEDATEENSQSEGTPTEPDIPSDAADISEAGAGGEATEDGGEYAEDGGEDDAEEGPQLPLASVVEAVLFAARGPLKLAQLARAVGKRTRQEAVRQAIEELNVQYLETSRAFEIAELSGTFQLMSRPEFVNHIKRIYPKKDLADREKAVRLTPAALDTLAIIAYKQPVTRADIEHIRGVGCGPVLRALIERGSVKVAGKRADLVGQPLVYGTTDAFLIEFGLGSLDELPHRNEFLGMMEEAES